MSDDDVKTQLDKDVWTVYECLSKDPSKLMTETEIIVRHTTTPVAKMTTVPSGFDMSEPSANDLVIAKNNVIPLHREVRDDALAKLERNSRELSEMEKAAAYLVAGGLGIMATLVILSFLIGGAC